MFNLCASIFGFVLNFIYGIVNNYGIAIIIFTIILKLILLPMTLNQQKTMKKTAKLQKQVREIQDKYSSDPTRMNQEVMDLYKKENMSPFSGCLTSILQFVVVLSMFYLVSKPLTYMLNVDQTILNDYTTKLQQESEDNKAIRYPEIAIIKNFADKDEKVNINMEFLGLDLSDVPTNNRDDWKVFIIPVLYVLTSVASMKMTTALNNLGKTNKEEKKVENTKLPEKVGKEEDTAEMMEQMNKNMNLMMPIMTVSIALIAPLGLALYWLLSNLLSIVERLFVYKFVKSEEE